MLRVVALLAFLSLMVQATTPSGLVQLNKKYFISKNKDTFLSALLTCKGSGYKMVSVTSKEDFIQLNNSIQVRQRYWLGGVYVRPQEFQPKWIWLDSGDELTYTNWGENEPKLFSGDDSLVMNNDGHWLAEPHSVYNYYICET